MDIKFKKGFTLLEVTVVIVITGVLAAFALANFDKSIRKGYEKFILTQLSTVKGASLIYKAQNNGSFWVHVGGDRNDINTNLRLEIPEDAKLQYFYTSDGTAYTLSIQYNDGSYNFMIRDVDANTPAFPCCNALLDACPSVPNC